MAEKVKDETYGELTDIHELIETDDGWFCLDCNRPVAKHQIFDDERTETRLLN